VRYFTISVPQKQPLMTMITLKLYSGGKLLPVIGSAAVTAALTGHI
jgi:hypothetical protein